MPFRSEKQRRFMHARHPGIAKRWEREYGSKAQPRKEALARMRKKRRR